MTTTTIDASDLANYVLACDTSGCKGENLRRRIKAADEFPQRLLDVHEGRIVLQPDAIYHGARKPIAVHCTVCGEDWTPTPDDLVNGGRGCRKCFAKVTSDRHCENRKALIGQTTADGHVILEHVGFHQTPSDKKRDQIGKAKYRYKCAICGNEEAIATGNNLKKQGHTTHCGCLKTKTKDTRLVFTRDEEWAESECYFYIFKCIANTAVKVGISNNPQTRKSKSYEEQMFVSQRLPRAMCWAIEQVLLHRLRASGFSYDLEDVPAFEKGKEGGASEVFSYKSIGQIIDEFEKLIKAAETEDWQSLLDRFIPLEEMKRQQLFLWNGERIVQSEGKGFLGQTLISFFN